MMSTSLYILVVGYPGFENSMKTLVVSNETKDIRDYDIVSELERSLNCRLLSVTVITGYGKEINSFEKK